MRKPGEAVLEAEPRKWMSLTERAERLTTRGRHLPTGFATLDRACRGGPRAGTLLLTGGQPGAGKTSLVEQIGLSYASRGVHVALLACDEGADGLLVRAGQLLGLDRDSLEDGRANAQLLPLLAQLPTLLLVDSDEDDAGIEDVAEELHERAAGGPSVLIVDSVQTARAAGTDSADGPRARVDAVMRSLKMAAKVHGHLVIATSELNRGSYGGGDPSRRVEDIASYKESGGAEYGATTAMVLKTIKGAEGHLVDVTMPKNRQGPRMSWRMSFDSERAKFTEIAAEPLLARDSVEEAKGPILLAIETAAPGTLRSKNMLVAAARVKRQPGLVAVDALQADGRIGKHEGAYVVVKP